MVGEITKYFNYAKKQVFQRKELNFLILYVTANCNFQCRTCFFHASLNQGNDLSLAEFEKISKNLGIFSLLLIGGGEPFLRADLKEIVGFFARNNKIDTLYIPTNGFLTEKILSTVEALLEAWPDLTISINPSLDGLGEYHDKLRGVPSAFANAIKTIEGLVALKNNHKNLQVIVNSVFHKENIGELKKLAVFLRQFNLDYHAFEVLRGDARDKTLAPADLAEIKEMHDFILVNRRWYFKKQIGRNLIFSFINKLVTLGHLAYTQYLKELVLAGKKWPMECVAGQTIAVVYPSGDVGQCELLGVTGNIRDYDYDLKKLLSASAAASQRVSLKNNRCHCTHICFINASLARDFKTVFKLPYFYLKNK